MLSRTVNTVTNWARHRRAVAAMALCLLGGLPLAASAQSGGAAPLLFAISEGTSGGGTAMNDALMAAKYKALTEVMEDALVSKP